MPELVARPTHTQALLKCTFLPSSLQSLCTPRPLSPSITATMGASAPQAASPTPYAGFQSRPIKALSEQQIADLKAGRGMGLALAAEMNGHPGPMHVLELGERLALTDAQRRTMEDADGHDAQQCHRRWRGVDSGGSGA